MNNKVMEIVGWYGTLAILAAYALSNFNIISTQTLLYQSLNVTGALGIVLISIKRKTYQPAVLNMIWAAIGMVILLKILLKY
ncbi:hypothetical protein KA062_00540 [Patescibacteria group bacterium]|jgi:hypothetical protein|nr:hypothetical protein [Patescibacteria group bacterium]